MRGWYWGCAGINTCDQPEKSGAIRGEASFGVNTSPCCLCIHRAIGERVYGPVVGVIRTKEGLLVDRQWSTCGVISFFVFKFARCKLPVHFAEGLFNMLC